VPISSLIFMIVCGLVVYGLTVYGLNEDSQADYQP
jgi:hypothetical protein